MDLQVEQRERGGVVILDLKGQFARSGEDMSLLRRLLFLLERTRPRVIVNLKRLIDVNADGLDTLVFSAMRFHECGGRLVLLRRAQPNPKLPPLVNVNIVPETYQKEADAVASFSLMDAVTYGR